MNLIDPLFELILTIDLQSNDTLLAQLTRQLRIAIVSQRLVAHFKMPASRVLSDHLNVSRNTVIRCYDILVSEGYCYTLSGKGTFVCQLPLSTNSSSEYEPPPQHTQRIHPRWCGKSYHSLLPSQPKRAFNFTVGVPDLTHFPYDTWRRLLARAGRMEQREKATIIGPQGSCALRRAIAQHIVVSRGIYCDADNIVITTGAQQAFCLLASVLLTPLPTGDVQRIAVESPGYPMAEAAFKSVGADIVRVPVDDEGIIVEAIPSDVQCVYVTPSHQFPLGMTLSARRRIQLLQWAEQHRVTIIEDDYDSEFQISGVPLDALKTQDHHNNVAYVGTFSKCMFPDIRVGFAILPAWLINAFLSVKFQTDWHNTWVIQQALTWFIQEGYLLKHLRKMRRIYREKYAQLQLAIEQYLSSVVNLIPVHVGVHATAMLAEETLLITEQSLQEQGVSICSVQDFSEENQKNNGLIFGFGDIRVEEIDIAIQQLAKAIEYKQDIEAR